MRRLYPPDHPLRSADLKLQRAYIHIQALRRSLAASLMPEVSIKERGEIKLPTTIAGMAVERAFVYTVEVHPNIRDQWGLIVGDIVGNLRHSLDHVAWALAREHERLGHSISQADARTVLFPLHDTELGFSDPSGGARAISHVLPAAHIAIEAFQPYHQQDWPELLLLNVLRRLSNEDKHRIVTPVLHSVSLSWLGDQGMNWPIDQPGEIKVLITERTAAKLGFNLHPDVTSELILDVGSPFQPFTVLELASMHEFIRNTVVPAFAHFFE